MVSLHQELSGGTGPQELYGKQGVEETTGSWFSRVAGSEEIRRNSPALQNILQWKECQEVRATREGAESGTKGYGKC